MLGADQVERVKITARAGRRVVMRLTFLRAREKIVEIAVFSTFL